MVERNVKDDGTGEKGPLPALGESLKKKRSWILYGTAVATLFLTAACWTLLPERVVMQAAVVGQAANAVAKETAILANLGLTGLFAALFAWRPKEVVYFVALCLAVLLQLSLLLVNLMV